MSASKVVILSIFLALIFTHIRADVSIEGELSDSGDETVKVVGSDGSADSSALKIELDQLKSKIQALGLFLSSLFSNLSVSGFVFRFSF